MSASFVSAMNTRATDAMPKSNTKQSVLNMTNEDIIKEFDKLHDDDAPLCFNEFDFDGWREYMFERGNKDPEEAIDASYMNHTEFDEEDEVWRINWEGEMPLECEESDEEEEEVRCVCPECYAEGWCMVSKRRAKELKKQELMEECCPWGDQCTAENSDEESDEEED